MVDVLAVLRAALAERYEIERELGHGGMAHVYAARDLRFGRRVAIKVLKPDLTETVGADRFQREIQIEARLQHQNILPLFDSGSAGGFLYYVMPLIEGQSLRERLSEERQLPIDDALSIAKQVGDALDYAHGQGVLHRDVKPENILLGRGHAWVADFGIARAMHAAGGMWHTETSTTVWRTDAGVVMGTLGYMSPEQAMAAEHLDGRSDQYGLACVVYEMLAGETPFVGRDLSTYVSKMLTLSPPSVRVVRDSVSPSSDAALKRALAKTPADRFKTCRQFVEALSTRRPVPRVWPRVAAVAAAGAIIVVALMFGEKLRPEPSPQRDTTRYVLLPVEVAEGVDGDFGVGRRLHDALARWDGLRIEDPFRVVEELGGDGAAPSARSAARVARKLGAGRYVRATVAPHGDSIRVHAWLFDAVPRGPPLAERSIRMPSNLAGSDSAAAALIDHLLFRGSAPEHSGRTGTRSLPAAQAFVRGRQSLATWDLAAADTAFTEAARFDPRYVQAHLWMAIVRSWGGGDPARWRIAAEQAALGQARLSSREQAMLDAVLAHTGGDLGRACRLWERVTERGPTEYPGWVGLARCLATDSAVVPDPRSPSRWSFRASYHRMLLAYERAFELHPEILGSWRTAAYDSLQRLLFTRGNARRTGKAVPPDTTRFDAGPSWQGDSLAFVPYPAHLVTSLDLGAPGPALAEAIQQQRRKFHRVARTWVAAFPRSPGALEALAASLAMLGDAAALDTLRSAHRVVTEPDERLRLAGLEVWWEVAFGLPFQRARLERARALADSLLARNPPPGLAEHRLLASLAALTGRAEWAAAYYLRDDQAGDAPPAVRPTARPLLLYATFGGPRDSLVALERRFVTALQGLSGDEHSTALDAWLVRAATHAFPTHRFASLPDLADRDNYLLELQLAAAAGDTARVRRGLLEIRAVRPDLAPETPTLDGLYPEAELLASLHDARGAAAWLDPTLAVLPRKAPRELTDPVRAASLLRALILRARLAAQLGDREGAAQWAQAVIILWSDADAFLLPIVNELSTLME